MALDGWKSNLSPDATAYLERMERKLEGLTRKISSAESTISYLTKVTNRITSGSTSSGVVQGVIPSSVNVGSGSYSVATDGTVSFTGVSSVSLNGVFDGLGMDTYEVIWVGYSSADGVSVRFRYRVSNTDLSTSNAYGTEYIYNVNGATGVGYVSDTAAYVGHSRALSSINAPSGFQAFVQSPNQSSMGKSVRSHSSAPFYVNGSLASFTQFSTAYTGFTIFPSSGTLTGQLKVVKVA